MCGGVGDLNTQAKTRTHSTATPSGGDGGVTPVARIFRPFTPCLAPAVNLYTQTPTTPTQ